MRIIFFLFFLSFVACKERTDVSVKKEDSTSPKPGSSQGKIYSNEHFKDVTATKGGDNTFLIKGKAQNFESSIGWVIEDGHDELQSGHQTTDARAPEWGKFSFIVNIPDKNPKSTLHIILFEVSTKDSSREYELPVLLN